MFEALAQQWIAQQGKVGDLPFNPDIVSLQAALSRLL